MEKVKQEMREENHDRRDKKRQNDRDRQRRPERQQLALETFRGKHKDLQGWVYTYDNAARAYQYAKTTEAITEWVKCNMRYPMDIWTLLTTLKEPDQNKWIPEKPTNVTDEETKNMIFSGEIKNYLKRKEEFKNNCCNVFSVILGQCNDSLQAKLKSQDDWETMQESNDALKLMKSVKVWMLNTEGSRCPEVAADAAVATLYRLRQNRYESLSDYQKRFTAASEVLEHLELEVARMLVGLTNKRLEDGKTVHTASSEDRKEAEKKALDKFLACRFLAAADKSRYGNVMVYLENEFVAGSDKLPKDVTTAYNYLENWRRGVINVDTPSNDGVAFVQGGASKDLSHIQCFRCGIFGHYQTEGKCDPDDVERWQKKRKADRAKAEPAGSQMHGSTNHMVAVGGAKDEDEYDSDDEHYRPCLCTAHMISPNSGAHASKKNEGRIVGSDGEQIESVMTHSFNSKRAYVIPHGSVGLDSMSSVDVFGDERMLSDIRTVNARMTIVCNAGEVTVTQMGDLQGYGPVWYHPGAIANILSLSNVQKRFRVRYDSSKGDFFTVERPDGTTRTFSPTRKGLYASKLWQPTEGAVMVTTVKSNQEAFTKREVKRATEARKLMAILGRPSEAHMREIVSQKQLQNCEVTEQDVRNALEIFGPDLGSLKGKTARRGEPHVTLEMRPIPPGVMERHCEVVVCFDVMYINGIAFTVSISRALKFGTVEAIKDRKADTLLTSLKHIKATYARRGFIASRVVGDNEFASLMTPLSNIGIALNLVTAGEHVPEVERHIRTLKERCRAIFNTLPYKRIPNRMLVELVYAVNFWLHAFPARDGVSTQISPRELVTGMMIDAKKHCVIAFGTYVQTHEPHDSSMKGRTTGAIALRPTGNAQGGHYFLSLETGRIIVRNHWTTMPAPAEVIARVEKMAENKTLNRLTFGDRLNNMEDEIEAGTDTVSIASSDAEVTDDDSPSGADSAPDSYDDDDGHDDNSRDIDDGPNAQAKHTTPAQPMPSVKREGIRIKAEPVAMPENRRDAHNEHPGPAAPHSQPTENADVQDAEATPARESGVEQDEHGCEQGETAEEQRATGVLRIQDVQRAGVPAAVEEEAEAEQETQRTGVTATKAAEEDESRQRERSRPQRMRKPSLRAREAMMNADTDDEEEVVEEKQTTRKKQRKKKKGACHVITDAAKHRAYPLAQGDTSATAPTFDAADIAGVQPNLSPLITTLLTQYGIKKGLRVFGKAGDDAVNEEMKQLHDMRVMTPKHPASISEQDRCDALQYLMFLKKKRDGRIKGRGCADGRKQRADAVKGEASSPTISTEAVFLLLTIAAKEGRDVMTMDIPGAFLQTDLDEGERIHVRFEGRMAELLTMINPKLYKPNIVVERGKPVLYAELKRALYGMLQSALRFWEQVLEDLTELGFTVNPYDWCVANRTVDGTQQTVGWHVDDFLATHKNPSVNDELAAWFDDKYGKRTPVAVHKGKSHDYLGMQINFDEPAKVRVTMIDYIDRMLDEAPTDFSGVAPTPAAKHLFETSGEATKLSEKQSNIFHNIVARSLFLAKRARPDIQLAVAFLCTRVQGSDEHDWKKLGRLVQYLRGTRELALTLQADEGRTVKWWVDSAFAVTQDMKSQSGGMMTLGRGAVCSSSLRQRLNTRSSTEAELVAANDFMPQILWTRHFLQAQGYDIRDNLLYQDNQSAILFETNGRGSSGKRTRHINIRYFFICDRVAAGELSVKFCPTEDMLGDFFTKPLQGAPFRKFRDQVLNIEA